METDTTTKTNPVDALVEGYVKLRDAKAELKAEYERNLAPIEQAMEKIEVKLMQTLDSMGLEAVKTSAGTAYATTKTSCGVADWDSFLSYIRQHELWNMLNHAANKTAVDEFRQANNDLPPGVNWRVERVVQIRRA